MTQLGYVAFRCAVECSTIIIVSRNNTVIGIFQFYLSVLIFMVIIKTLP